MNDIYSRNTSVLGGVFTADNAKVVFKGNLAVLVQSLQFNYSQQITRLYDVTSPTIYYVGGRTTGRLSISRIIGPTASVTAFYTQYGNVCKAAQNLISLVFVNTDCSTGANNPATYDMYNCVIEQVSVGVQAESMIISDSTTMIFSSLTATG